MTATKWNPDTYRWEDVEEPAVQVAQWPKDVATATANPVPQPEPLPEPTPTPKEPTIEENAMTIRGLFEGMVNKAVESTELARRVSELEDKLQGLVHELQEVRTDLNSERIAHEETKASLRNVQAELARKESVVHDLVLERDIVIGERNAAQSERDSAKEEARHKQTDNDFLAQSLREQDERNRVLTERCEMLTQRIAGLRTAFAALNDTV